MTKVFLPIILLSLMVIYGCSNNSTQHQYTGILEGTSIQVPALTPGQITNIFVSSGEYVETDQLLATVDSTELIYQRDQLTATHEELVIQMQIARSNLNRIMKDYDYLKTKYDRIANLYKSESVTKQDLDDISNNLQNAQTALINAKTSLGSIEAGKKRVEAQIKSVNKKIKDAGIVTSNNGIITNIYYETGEAVRQFAPIMEIIDIREMEVKIYIAEDLLSQIKYGQNVTIQIDGLEESFDGKVVWISPKAEFTPKTILTPNTRTSLVYAVKISIMNKDDILKHGMPVVISL